MLEAERDRLRERLTAFERGEEDLAYRTERAGLQAEVERRSEENEELRRRIFELTKRRRPALGALTRVVEDLLRRFVDRGK